MHIRNINPATEEINYEYETMNDSSIQTIAEQCSETYSHWKSTGRSRMPWIKARPLSQAVNG